MEFLHKGACVDAHNFEAGLDRDGITDEAYEILQRPSPTSPNGDLHPVSTPTQSPTHKRNSTSQLYPPTEHIRSLSLNDLNEQKDQDQDEILSSSYLDISSNAGLDTDSLSERSYGEENSTRNTSLEASQISVLKPHHPFQILRLGLVQFAFEKIHTWICTASYVAPPERGVPQQPRVQATSLSRDSVYVEEDVPGDNEAVVLSRIQGYYNLACPYYVFNPAKYLSCLQQHDLRSIEDVIAHLNNVHTEPPYCPRCRQTFSAAIDRDRHFYVMKCKFREFYEIDGITSRQKVQMADRDDPKLSIGARWKTAWSTVFPDEEPRCAPYLDSPLERAIAITRDFWANHGINLILHWLASHNLSLGDSENDADALLAFHTSILDDLITKTLQELSPT